MNLQKLEKLELITSNGKVRYYRADDVEHALKLYKNGLVILTLLGILGGVWRFVSRRGKK
jgi:hypothetical protein